jgi:hypothetical protein
MVFGPYYNVWNTIDGRWTNSSGQDVNNPRKLTKKQAENLLKDLGSFMFEVRALNFQEIPKDQKCCKCQKACPHELLQQNTCVSCAIIMELDNAEI